MEWSDADIYCTDIHTGSHLLDLQTSAEQEAVRQVTMDHCTYMFINANDIYKIEANVIQRKPLLSIHCQSKSDSVSDQ